MTDSLQRAKDLASAYASIEIPDLVREDVEKDCFFHKTTLVVDMTGRVDTHQTMLNEGFRMAWVRLFQAIDQGRRPVPTLQTHAVSETAETT